MMEEHAATGEVRPKLIIAFSRKAIERVHVGGGCALGTQILDTDTTAYSQCCPKLYR